MTTTVDAVTERAIPWTPAAAMPTSWVLEVQAQSHTDPSSLVLDVELSGQAEYTVESWRFSFAGVAAFRLDPIGFPENPSPTRYDWSRRLKPPPKGLWITEDSAWLKSCRTGQCEPQDLTHFVLHESHRHRVWHIAATRCDARPAEPGERLVALEQAVLVSSSEAYQPVGR